MYLPNCSIVISLSTGTNLMILNDSLKPIELPTIYILKTRLLTYHLQIGRGFLIVFQLFIFKQPKT